ncbi:MAG: hypothetical protein O3A10_03735 [Chloroflexi bacterium]|nr:hypothetical protein [Chloroflexota bacterium]MDA1145847.1 hypothetical protein [Chloroflexota bacterium]
MADHEALTLAHALWPSARDRGMVDDPNMLDRLLETRGQPGAIGYDCGLRDTFACFAPDELAELTLPGGERTTSDEEARFIAHILVTRTLLAAGLHVDQRVIAAMGAAYALSWTSTGDRHGLTPLALAASLWLVALDPLSLSDRPLDIDWSADCFDDPERWDPEYRLFSHYDVRERGIDWSVYASGESGRRAGCSIYSIVEPLLRMDDDNRVRIALSAFAQTSDAAGESAPAAAMLERGRIAAMLQGNIRLYASR